ncbi:MAG: polymer-forming cytoskeletal protein [Candidatus Manganitrophaceae bacterium]|nr:MAG: polymer-forming cytoskeletal protein [Candidatus Manganitrophaceae bacterium]
MGSVFGKEENGKKGVEDIIIYMGKNVEIKGNVNFEGSGRIDGKIEGKITVKGSIIFGEGAVITSDVEGDTVVVGGKVTGKIVAHQKIQLLRTSIFTGDLMTPSLLIEDGAQFNGSCKMTSTDTSHERFEKEEIKTPAIMAVR